MLICRHLHKEALDYLKLYADVECTTEDREILLKVIGSFDGIITDRADYDKAVMWEARRLKVIACKSYSIDLLQEANKKEIHILNSDEMKYSFAEFDILQAEDTIRLLNGNNPKHFTQVKEIESDNVGQSACVQDIHNIIEDENLLSRCCSIGGVGSEAKLILKGDAIVGKVTFNSDVDKPSVILNCKGLNLDRYLGISLDIVNTGKQKITIYGYLNKNLWCAGFEEIEAGQSGELIIDFKRHQEKSFTSSCFKGMNGLPDGRMWLWDPIDTTKIQSLCLYLLLPEEKSSIDIISIKPFKPIKIDMDKIEVESFYPFIDEYGQYIHKDWPGKTNNKKDLICQRELEEKDLQKYTEPKDWNKFGGWSAGPRFKSTGHFRTEKYNGKWWLVDPDGCLFWSHGMDCVRIQQSTETEGRQYYFKNVLPEGDYRSQNLMKKYGSDWEEYSKKLAHRRLRSWGMNTMACWCQEDIYQMQKTPYIAWIETRSWLKREFPQVDSKEWLERFIRNMNEVLEKTSDDPWCIGYYVDNEIHGSMDTLKWEKYFSIVSEKLKTAAPHKLYLGSRFDYHWYPDMAAEFDDIVKLAGIYCDVISFNLYRYTMKDFLLPRGMDKPVIIGEYHFGALDRGLPHTGLRSTKDQKQRAKAYHNYVSSCLDHKQIVGSGWFQYCDQPYTGRNDGENYQIGFVDICDKPYEETIAACRDIGRNIYARRIGII